MLIRQSNAREESAVGRQVAELEFHQHIHPPTSGGGFCRSLLGMPEVQKQGRGTNLDPIPFRLRENANLHPDQGQQRHELA